MKGFIVLFLNQSKANFPENLIYQNQYMPWRLDPAIAVNLDLLESALLGISGCGAYYILSSVKGGIITEPRRQARSVSRSCSTELYPGLPYKPTLLNTALFPLTPVWFLQAHLRI